MVVRVIDLKRYAIASVPPPTWTSAEQEDFIKDVKFYTAYMQCQAKRDYSTFWPPFFEKWFAAYPEWRVVCPDVPDEAALSDDQKTLVNDAVKQRRKVREHLPQAGTAALTGHRSN